MKMENMVKHSTHWFLYHTKKEHKWYRSSLRPFSASQQWNHKYLLGSNTPWFDVERLITEHLLCRSHFLAGQNKILILNLHNWTVHFVGLWIVMFCLEPSCELFLSVCNKVDTHGENIPFKLKIKLTKFSW